ncbi:leucyl aminopeptidase [Corynebacterium sp. Q4381]|uniref:leucyl aminopeptidase n=1 Tax=Corynebacterium sp. Marseille-Q4381 TaxID=3121597 RepID=UPI002FE68E87
MAINTLLPARGASATVDFSDTAPENATLIVPVSRGEDGLEVPVTRFAAGGLLEALSAVGATGSAGETVRLLVDGRVYLTTGLGKDITDEAVRRAYGAAARSLKAGAVAAASCEFGVAAVAEGLLLGSYAYQGLKSKDEDDAEEGSPAITVVGDAEHRAEFERAAIIADSVNLARDLVNTPGNFLAPAAYADAIKHAAAPFGLEVEDFGVDELRAQGFGGILAVGAGSANAPHLVHVGWRPEGAQKRVALVGKGITFDTGGISLKPAAKMEEMISDMGGSAAQLGAVIAAARLNLPVAVDAWLPLAENMPSGSATRPGDVITHYGGTTSEVLNTDAEGRLVLADAIARACEDTGEGQPDYLIETATLTGAQLVALGTRTAGVMGTDEFRDSVAATGREVGEPAWAMPLLEEQNDELKSPVADIRNTHNARTGGMLFAGLYLSRFVPEGTQWVHIDIAGPAWNGGKAYGYTPARATGAPVRTIVATLTQLAEA